MSACHFSVVATALMLALPASAEHFNFQNHTGNNMTVLVKTAINPSIGQQPIKVGDEIGVFTDDGRCVGAGRWERTNIAITIWGDDDQTSDVDGIAAGDTLRFRIWDASTETEFPASVSYAAGSSVYSVDGISILRSLDVPDDPLSSR